MSGPPGYAYPPGQGPPPHPSQSAYPPMVWCQFAFKLYCQDNNKLRSCVDDHFFMTKTCLYLHVLEKTIFLVSKPCSKPALVLQLCRLRYFLKYMYRHVFKGFVFRLMSINTSLEKL